MTRAVLLPTPCDPFLMNFWLDMYKRWGDRSMKLYVGINSPLKQTMVNYVSEKIRQIPNTCIVYRDSMIDHGAMLNLLLDECTEDTIMLVEDDCFIWNPYPIYHAFDLIESGSADIVGSKRGSCGHEILKRAREVWGLDYEGYGDNGCNFWPNLFFCKRETLLNTDRNFSARMWRAGETIDELNYVCQTDQAGDTFVNTSLQLRAKFPEHRIAYIPQYHGHPNDWEHYQSQTNLFDGGAPWIHVGSLSSGMSGLLTDAYGIPLDRCHLTPVEYYTGKEPESVLIPNAPKDDFSKMEYERRIAFFTIFNMEAKRTIETDEFLMKYGEAIERIIRQFGLSQKRIYRMVSIYRELMKI